MFRTVASHLHTKLSWALLQIKNIYLSSLATNALMCYRIIHHARHNFIFSGITIVWVQSWTMFPALPESPKRTWLLCGILGNYQTLYITSARRWSFKLLPLSQAVFGGSSNRVTIDTLGIREPFILLRMSSRCKLHRFLRVDGDESSISKIQ